MSRKAPFVVGRSARALLFAIRLLRVWQKRWSMIFSENRHPLFGIMLGCRLFEEAATRLQARPLPADMIGSPPRAPADTKSAGTFCYSTSFRHSIW